MEHYKTMQCQRCTALLCAATRIEVHSCLGLHVHFYTTVEMQLQAGCLWHAQHFLKRDMQVVTNSTTAQKMLVRWIIGHNTQVHDWRYLVEVENQVQLTHISKVSVQNLHKMMHQL